MSVRLSSNRNQILQAFDGKYFRITMLVWMIIYASVSSTVSGEEMPKEVNAPPTGSYTVKKEVEDFSFASVGKTGEHRKWRVETKLSGYSGKGYARGWSWISIEAVSEFDVPKDGQYFLWLRAHADGRVVKATLGNAKSVQFTLPGFRLFGWTLVGRFDLKAGKTPIVLASATSRHFVTLDAVILTDANGYKPGLVFADFDVLDEKEKVFSPKSICARAYYKHKMPTTPDEWNKRAKLAREKLFEETGFRDVPVAPLDPRSEILVEMNGYLIEHVSYQATPSWRHDAIIYWPADRKARKVPVIVTSGHGHGVHPGKNIPTHWNWIARKGVAVMHPLKYNSEYSMGYGRNFVFGDTVARYNGTVARAALDYLYTCNEVDREKIVSMGKSGGGNNAYWSYALNERFKALVVGGTERTYELNTFTPAGCFGGYVMRWVNKWGIYGLSAPQPICRLGDEQVQPIGKRLQELYKVYGAESKIKPNMAGAAGHSWSLAQQQMALEWLADNFLGMKGRFDDLSDIFPAEVLKEPEKRGDRKCLLTNEQPFMRWISDKATETAKARNIEGKLNSLRASIGKFRRQRPKADWAGVDARKFKQNLTKKHMLPANKNAALDWQKKTKAELQLKIFDPFPDVSEFESTTVAKTIIDGFRIEKIKVVPETEQWYPALLFFPKASAGKAGLPVVIYLHNEGKLSAYKKGLVVPLLERGVAVFAVDLRSTGEMRGNLGSNIAITGRPLAAIWMLDVIRAVDYLEGREDVDGSRISVVGERPYSYIAALAAAYEERISSVAFIGGYPTYFDDHGGFQSEVVIQIPRILFYTDLPHLYSLVAPRPFLVLNAGTAPVKKSPAGVLAKEEVEKALAWTRGVYRAMGKEKHLTIGVAKERKEVGDLLGNWLTSLDGKSIP